jgi:manganese transport protein
VQTRIVADTIPAKREAIKFATIDSTIALMLALFVNASILILAAATFNKVGQTGVADLEEAHKLLSPLLGTTLAATLFGIALLCCGLNSTVTATLSGQIVMEGFINVRLPAWARRLATRSIAIIPAIIAVVWYGGEGTGKLIILSQVILSMQLPFAIVPLVTFTADRSKMGELVAPRWTTVLAWIVAVVVIALNMKVVYDIFAG